MSVFTTMGITTAAGSETTSKIAVGTAGQIFTSNGTSSLPAFKGSLSTTNGIVKFDGTTITTSSTALIDASNRMTNTSQPAFLAGGSLVSNVTGDGTVYTVSFSNEIFDQGSNYNNETFIFTAPVTGRYVFYFGLTARDLNTATHTQNVLSFVSTGLTLTAFDTKNSIGAIPTNTQLSFSGSCYVNMAATDTARIDFTSSGGTKTVGITAGYFFGGYLAN